MPKSHDGENTHSRRRLLIVAPLLLAIAQGCATGPLHPQAQLGLDHPLTGKIWDVKAGTFVTEAALADRLADARFVLIGEQHDNPNHHALQGRIIRALVARERRPAVVMEMLDVDDTEAIHECLKTRRCSPRRLADAVEWSRSGWPDWGIYEPVLDAALDERLPIAPASLPAGAVHTFAMTGALPGGEHEFRRLGLDAALEPAIRDAIAADIRESHCGYAPERMIEGMVAAQRLRDAHMAEAMMMAAPLGRAVLIAGAEHARNDRAAPARLRVAAPQDLSLSVGLLEVDDRFALPLEYAARFGTGRLPFDFVWFTARLDDEDPCEKFREQLEKLRQPGGEG